jgi:hypothetical protein
MKTKTLNRTNFFFMLMLAIIVTLATISGGCKKNTVTPSNIDPTVSITSPANNSSFNAPATVNITASAADADGSITKVEFYNGATLLTTLTVAPYAYSLTNLAIGTYTITAKAYDNSSASTSASVTITVNPDQSLCGDTICHLPWRLMPTFIPSGYYSPNSDLTTTLTLDSVGETPAYPNEGIRIVYTYNGNYWGASFLNNNSWTDSFNIKNTATKITFKLRMNYSSNVTFNAFANQNYGKVEKYQLATPVASPVWEDISIPLISKPSNFAAPLNVVIDFSTPPAIGTKIVVDIKDLQFE